MGRGVEGAGEVVVVDFQVAIALSPVAIMGARERSPYWLHGSYTSLRWAIAMTNT